VELCLLYSTLFNSNIAIIVICFNRKPHTMTRIVFGHLAVVKSHVDRSLYEVFGLFLCCIRGFAGLNCGELCMYVPGQFRELEVWIN
jgi:hypothetical protein